MYFNVGVGRNNGDNTSPSYLKLSAQNFQPNIVFPSNSI